MAAAVTAKAPIAALPDVGMSQSTILVGTLIGGFILYLALTNRLGVYWSFLTGGTGSGSTSSTTTTPAPAPSGGNTGSGGSTLPSPGSSGAPWLIPPIPSIGFPGVAMPANPLPTPSPGTGYPGS